MTLKIVHVTWIDSQTADGWTPFSDIESDLHLSHTVGIFLKESENFVLIAHSIDPETESYNGVMTIPKAAIQKQRTLCRVKV